MTPGWMNAVRFIWLAWGMKDALHTWESLESALMPTRRAYPGVGGWVC